MHKCIPYGGIMQTIVGAIAPSVFENANIFEIPTGNNQLLPCGNGIFVRKNPRREQSPRPTHKSKAGRQTEVLRPGLCMLRRRERIHPFRMAFGNRGAHKKRKTPYRLHPSVSCADSSPVRGAFGIVAIMARYRFPLRC